MINFPEATLFSDSDLEKAYSKLTPTTFKLFVYLYQQAQKYKEQGDGHESEYAFVLSEKLKLDNEELLAGFLYLREINWLDAFSAGHDPFRQKLIFRWRMYLNEMDKAEGVDGQYVVEDILARRRYDNYIAIGTSRIQPKAMNQEINNSHWRKIRKKVLARDRYECQECRATKNLHVHHITYENKGNEKMEDLITLCRSCHAKKRHDK